jgi:molecular chaperone DnaK (HSP70)
MAGFRNGRQIEKGSRISRHKLICAGIRFLFFCAFLQVVATLAIAQSIGEQDARICKNLFIVLYDFSWRTLDPDNLRISANQYITELLFGSHQDIPTWNPGDCLCFYSFGMDRDDLEVELRNAGHNQFWNKWKHLLLHPGINSPNQTSDIVQARAFVHHNLPTINNHTYFYNLASYALPTLIASLPHVYANAMYIVWISDFFPEDVRLKDIDQGLVQKYLGTISGTLDLLYNEYSGWTSRIQVIDRSRSEVHGLHSVVLELKLPRLKLDFPDSAQLIQKPDLRWWLVLPKWQILPSGWFCDSLDLELNEHDTSRNLARWSVETTGIDNLPIQSDLKSVISESQTPSLRVGGTAKLHFSAGSTLGLTIYTVESLKNVPVGVSPQPTFVQSWGRFLSLLFLLFVCLVVAIFGRKPRWDLQLQTAKLPLEPDPYRIEERTFPILPWAKDRIYRIPLSIRNCSDALNMRIPAPFLKLEAHAPIGSGVEFRLRAENLTKSAGELIHLRRLRSGTSINGSVLIDLSHQMEPLEVIGPFEFTVCIKGCRTTWAFALSPDPGNFWLGLDPGTSGACIAGGSNPENLDLVPLRQRQVTEEDRCVIPSLVYVCTGEREADSYTPRAFPFRLNGEDIRYIAGDQATQMETLPEATVRLFRSAKRLVGYRNPFILDYEKKPIQLFGQDAVGMLADFLVSQARAYFERRQSHGQQLRINKIVLAVPNMFTPGKIQQMRHCCQIQGVKRVLAIYEAEAVLVYYWWRTASLHPEPDNAEELRSKSGERVLIMDFGGGGVNFTYARIEQLPDNQTHIHILQRLGFAIGGDHLDWEIARILWQGIQQKAQLDPYAPAPADDPRPLRNLLLRTAALVKMHASRSWNADRKNQAYTFPQPEFRDWWKGQAPSASSLLADEGIQNRLAELGNAIEEIRELCISSGCWEPIDTLIFSGRSTRFPSMKEQIIAKINSLDPEHEPIVIDLDRNQEAKTCVSRGAALWGMQQANIHLHSNRTFAHYGIIRHKPGGAQFDSLIPAGTSFSNGVCEKQVFSEIYPFNNDELALVQVMASSPQNWVGDGAAYTRKSILGIVRIDSNRNVDQISLKLSDRDDFALNIEQGNHLDHANGGILLDDIRKDGDPSAEWLLDLPGNK